MIGRITGTLLEKNPPQIVVDVHGLGYDIDVPMSTFYNLPATGDKVSLFTHFAVREDGQFLYGFGSADERSAFRALLKVSGIGARTALSVLSGMSVADLHQAITLQESARLIRIPGIGKKTAERMLLELRDRLGQALPGPGMASVGNIGIQASAAPDNRSDIMNALLALGYNDREAVAAMKAVPEDSGVSDGIRLALKKLARA